MQDGCNVMCSFCLIPFARGRERSRVLGDITREAETVVAAGHREVVLTGVNIGQYWQDGQSLLGVIRELERIEGLERIRISSIEPTTITDDLLEWMGCSSKLCPYLHVPLQSGNDRILSAMNRPYRVSDFEQLMERAMQLVPDLGLGTDVMVGFPGETEREFQHTIHLVEKLPFSYCHVFTYSPSAGTSSLKLPGRVPLDAARDRAKRLSEVSRTKRMAFAERYIGATVMVLFESGEIDGFKLGTTKNFLRVGVSSDLGLSNQTKSVLVSGATDRWAVGRLAETGYRC